MKSMTLEQRYNKLEKCFWGVSIISIFGLLVCLFIELGQLPVVYVSHSMDHCVLVIDPVTNHEHTDFSCENLPPKYSHVWVE